MLKLQQLKKGFELQQRLKEVRQEEELLEVKGVIE